MNSRGRGVERRRAAAVAVVLGLIGVGLWGCGFGRSPYADVPQLEVAWVASVGDGDLASAVHVATEDQWISFDRKSSQLVALRLTDGERAWALPSAEPCGFSEVNSDGLIAVRSGAMPTCDRVELIDTSTGKATWSSEVEPDGSLAREAGQVGLSDRTVTAAGVCGVERWEVGSGKKLPPIRGSEKFSDVPGHCRPALTSTNLAVVVEADALVGYDVDTGKKRWARNGKDPDLGSLLSADPLIAVAQIDGVAGLRSLDGKSGELGPIIGRPSARLPSTHAPSVVDDKVVGSYRGTPDIELDGTYKSAVRAWDPASGEEIASWPGRKGDEFLGAGDDGVYLGRKVSDGRSEWGSAYWLTRSDWSGKQPRTLGWTEDSTSASDVVGDLLIATGHGERADGSNGERVVAYKLPSEATSDAIPSPQDEGESRWAKGDVRPDPTTDPCAEASAETLRDIGFEPMRGSEAPLSCQWISGTTSMTTSVHVVEPDSGGSAVGNASVNLARAGASMESAAEVDGLGDEAWASVSARVAKGPDEAYQLVDPAATSTEMHVGVRQKNVVAYVRLTDWRRPDEGALPPLEIGREADVIAALEDMFAAVGEKLSLPDVVSDGPITSLPQMCDVVADDVRKVLPAAKAIDLTTSGDSRFRGCVWTTRRDGYVASHVQVVAYAVGASPITGATGSAAAEKVFADSRGELATPRRDKGWDESAMAEDYSGSYSDGSHFIGRSENLIVVVNIRLRDQDKSVAPTVAPRMATHALAAIRP